MAALDFGMAKARGLIAPTADYEAKVKSAAGGTNMFKSEDWWNKQLDQAIKAGFTDTVTKRFINERSAQKAGFMNTKPVYEMVPSTNPRRRGRLDRNLVGYEGAKVEDVTPEVLKKITATTKQASTRLKEEKGKREYASKRLSRATGGLLAKAPIPGTEGMATGLPVLGETGLGIVGSMLGVGTEL